MFLGICNEKCHYVHDDMCSWPDTFQEEISGYLEAHIFGSMGAVGLTKM